VIINQQQQQPQKFQIPIFLVPILDSGCTTAQQKEDVGKYYDNWYFPGGTSNNHDFRFQFFGYQFCWTLNGHHERWLEKYDSRGEKEEKSLHWVFGFVDIVCLLTHQSLIKQQQRIKMLVDTCSYFSPWAKLP